MKRASDVTCLCFDRGLFVEFAAKLAQTFKRVLYYAPNGSAFPKINPTMVGYGYDNLELVTDPFGEHFDDVDLFAFLDCGWGPTQAYLEAQDKVVWGSRMGEELEFDRVGCKKAMVKAGLPVGPYTVVKGMDALQEHLKTHKDQVVKVNRYRGTCETFIAKSYDEIEQYLKELDQKLGAFGKVLSFVCEDLLPDCVEVGTDLFTVDGDYPTRFLSGFEVKDAAYIGAIRKFSDFPEPLTRWNAKMAPVLAKYGYRGPISTEIRIDEKQVPYAIDLTCRLPSPPNELYQELYANVAEMVWQGANGVMVDPEPLAKYGAEVIGLSQWAVKNWQPIRFPDKYRRNVKLHNGCRIDGQWYVIPQDYELAEVVSVVGWGETKEAAVKMVADVAGEVKAHTVKFNLDAFKECDEQIAMAKEYGVPVL